MKLRICGYIPKRTKKVKLERHYGEYARAEATKRLGAHPRIKTVQVTFFRGEIYDYTMGFHWLVKGDRVEIALDRHHMRRDVHWLIRHELSHAAQILEGRLNKSLARTVFTNRRGQTRTFVEELRADGRYRYIWAWRCLENGRLYYERQVPWEKEVQADERRWLRKNRKGVKNVARK